MTLVHDRSGRGEPLVLLHGFTSNRHIWSPVVPLLEGERDVVRIDLPGFGDTPPLPSGDEPSPARLADEVERFLQGAGLDRAHLAGNSMGGWIALELARRGRALSTCALSPAGFWNRWEREYSRALFVQTRASAKAMGGAAERVYAHPGLRRQAAYAFMDHADRMPSDEALLAIRGVRDCPGFWSTWRALHSRHFTGAAEVRGPVTVAWAEHDRVLLPRQAERARRAMPRARHVRLFGCGHVPTYDDPQLVARTILTSV